MTKDEFLEAAKSEGGAWILGRNLGIERFFENQPKKPKVITQPIKIYYDGEDLVMISFDEYGSPAIFAYSANYVEISDENGEIILNLRRKPEYYDYYVRPDCSPEEYLTRFMRTWKLSEDEYRKYAVSQELKDLSTVLIDPLAK